jgi:hypothetical protein
MDSSARTQYKKSELFNVSQKRFSGRNAPSFNYKMMSEGSDTESEGSDIDYPHNTRAINKGLR